MKITHRLQLSGDFQQLILHLDADFFALEGNQKQISGLKRSCVYCFIHLFQ